MPQPHRRVLAIFSLNLLVFFLARIGLFLVYFQDFHDLTVPEVLRAFARGASCSTPRSSCWSPAGRSS